MQSRASLIAALVGAALLAVTTVLIFANGSTVNSATDRATPVTDPVVVATVTPPATNTPTAVAVEPDEAQPEPDDAVAEPSEFADVLASPLAGSLPADVDLEAVFGGGTWELHEATNLVPGTTGRTTCIEPDPPFLAQGINAKFQTITHHQYVLVQIQRGEDADEAVAWRELVARFPDCSFGVTPSAVPFPGVDDGIVLAPDGPSPDGYWTIASATKGDTFIMVVGGGYDPDANTLDPEVLAQLAGEMLDSL